MRTMRKHRRLFSIIGGILLALNACAPRQDLHLFIWSEYIDPKVISQFEDRFHCKVLVDLYEDEESMLAKLQGGGASLYDVVVSPEHLIPAMVQLKLLAPLDHARLPNLQNIDPKFLNLPFDRGNQHTVPYQWGTVGVFLRKKPGQPVQPSWSAVFDRTSPAGAFVLIDSARDLIGAALKYQGHSLNSVDPGELRAAGALLIDAKRRSLAMDGSVGGKNKVLARAAAAAIVYSGEGARGMKEDPETLYFVPKEGSQIWVDNLAILAQASNPRLAEEFINFVLEPEPGARISNFTQFASPNRAALPLIDQRDLKNPAIYPPAEVLDRLEFLKDVGPSRRRYDEIWTQIKSK